MPIRTCRVTLRAIRLLVQLHGQVRVLSINWGYDELTFLRYQLTCPEDLHYSYCLSLGPIEFVLRRLICV